MDTGNSGFIERLKTAVRGTAEFPLVCLGNFEVEEQWAADELGLPRVSAASGAAVVNSMDEFALLLGGKGDHVVLKHAPDPDYRGYLLELGLDLPEVHVPSGSDPGRNVSQDALADPALIGTLAELASDGAHLLPHGTSEVEEELSARTGVPLATPPAALCKSVNSKVYSRLLCDELGLRQPHGWAADTLTEFTDALPEAAKVLAEGHQVVVKEAFGVSGKGISVVTNEQRLYRLQRMIEKSAHKAGRERIAMVIETWVDKKADLNYQFTIGRDGSVRFDFVKEAITEGGVHKGHRMPARLDRAQRHVIEVASYAIGARLAADGYYGVVGVDALVEPDGDIFPVLEINARNNMSTYQVPIQERFVPEGAHAMARHYPVRRTTRLPFGELRDAMSDLLFSGTGNGLLVNNFATVNAGATLADDGAPFTGRLYGLLIAGSVDELDALDDEITERLATLMVS